MNSRVGKSDPSSQGSHSTWRRRKADRGAQHPKACDIPKWWAEWWSLVETHKPGTLGVWVTEVSTGHFVVLCCLEAAKLFTGDDPGFRLLVLVLSSHSGNARLTHANPSEIETDLVLPRGAWWWKLSPQSSSNQVLWSPLPIHLFGMFTWDVRLTRTPCQWCWDIRWGPSGYSHHQTSVWSSHLVKRDSPCRVVHFVRMWKIKEKRDAVDPLKLPITPTR